MKTLLKFVGSVILLGVGVAATYITGRDAFFDKVEVMEILDEEGGF